MDKTYNPKRTEETIYEMWEKGNYFTPKIEHGKKPYTIAIPPPNVTGSLHMGHALNNTIQDILIRWQRMKGTPTLWIPGTDHAGIATQNVVEKKLAKQGKTRHDVGRKKLVAEIWKWKDQYEATILGQLKTLGCSCDWTRTRFTMDEGYYDAVIKAFTEFYKKGYLYRGKRVINWCPRCYTSLSDLEIEYEEEDSLLYYIDYPLADKGGVVTVATTRPETMLGDTAIAVHPKDWRFKNFIGKKVIIPIVKRSIPVITDNTIEMEFGTGAVKVTPAHDFTDFDIGQRHKLPSIIVIGEDGKMTKEAPQEYYKMDRYECREALTEHLKKGGFLRKVEELKHNVGHCYRCATVVEPLLSDQWFVNMEKMAKPAIKVVEQGKVKFIPAKYKKVYLDWMKNLKDWCVSRQIWWGHRIPVWYCQNCKTKKFIVSEHEPKKCPECGKKNFVQDPDVLDTWFSSALWPFATLGWPKKTKDLDYFYPTNILSTARDIIYLWVARMIMTGLEFMKEVPFSDVYIHATVFNKEGKRMSKSLGTGVDPLDLIDKYGADSTRMGLVWQVAKGQDMKFGEEALLASRNFINKLWNAARFITDKATSTEETNPEPKTMADKWILSRLQKVVKETEDNIADYEFSDAIKSLYDFVWKELCDWYLEISKLQLENTGLRKSTEKNLVYLLDKVLRLLHPFVPHATESIWQELGRREPLVTAHWPKEEKRLVDSRSEKELQVIIGIVTAVRNVRADYKISPQRKIDAVLHTQRTKEIEKQGAVIIALAGLESLDISAKSVTAKNSAVAVSDKTEIYVPLAALIDIKKEKESMRQEIARIEKFIKVVQDKLKNKGFVENAPKEVVALEKQKLADQKNRLTKLKKQLKSLA